MFPREMCGSVDLLLHDICQEILISAHSSIQLVVCVLRLLTLQEGLAGKGRRKQCHGCGHSSYPGWICFRRNHRWRRPNHETIANRPVLDDLDEVVELFGSCCWRILPGWFSVMARGHGWRANDWTGR